MQTVESVLASLTARGIRLVPDSHGLITKPASKLTDGDREAIRAHKVALLAHARAERPTRDMAPDSRHPLIPDTIREKIEAIEAEARAKGWPAELLWNNAIWDLPRGIAAVLDADDEIGEVTPDYIEIWKLRRNRQRFMRRVA
jgi:hypothetical protein